MTAPRVISPEEWEAKQKKRPLSPEEWDLKRQAMGGLGTRRIPLPSAAGDVTREVGGVNDPERWKSAIHKQGTTEQLALGMVGLPFAAVKEPVQTAKAIAADVAQGFGIAKVGRGLSERFGHGAPALRKSEGGMLEPTREPVSDVEIAGALLNVAGLAAGSFKGQPKAAPVRTPRPGIVRVPAAEVPARLARVQGVGDVLERLRTPEAVDMAPQNVPLPPAQRAYPFGATTGELKKGNARLRFTEPSPTPFTRPGVRRLTEMPETAKPLPEGAPVSTEAARSAEDFAARVKAAADKAREARPATTEAFPEGFSTKSTRVTRRPASRVPSPEEWEAQQTAKQAESVPEPRAPEPVPVVAEPVSVGRDLAEPSRIPADAPKVPRPRGAEPSGIVETPEGVVSAGPRTLQPPQKKTLSPIGHRNVTAEQMLEVGKQRAAELEAGTVARSAPDLTPALKREGRMFGEPVSDEPMPPPVMSEGGATLPVVEGTGEMKTRGLSQSVNERAVAEKLTTSLGDLPEFRTVNMADQAAKATKLLAQDAEQARRIALGEAPPPADLLPESVFAAVENRAIAEGDVGMLRDLASGDLTAQATTMGQRIRALAERSPESPVAAIQKVIEARMQGSKNARAATVETVQTLQRHIAEAVKMDPKAWTTFIDGLRC